MFPRNGRGRLGSPNIILGLVASQNLMSLYFILERKLVANNNMGDVSELKVKLQFLTDLSSGLSKLVEWSNTIFNYFCL